MKTIRLFFALVVTGFVTMSMGFPTDLASDKVAETPEACPDSQIVVNADVNRIKAVVDTREEEPVEKLSMPMLAATTRITVKVYNAKGVLVVNQQVTMDEFLAKSKIVSLPQGSTFVMFHQNTAYYFLETGLA